MRNCVIFSGLVFVTGVAVVPAQQTPSFVVPADLPAAGLRILVPAQSVEEPLPPLSRHMFELRQGDRTWTEERYAPREIWLRQQLLGQWRDAHGNRLRILQTATRLPDGLEGPYVLRSVYDERLAGLPDLRAAASEPLLGWLADYLEEAPGHPEGVSRGSVSLLGVALVPTRFPDRLLYVMRVSVPQVGRLDREPRNYVVDIQLVPEADPVRTRRSFEDRFLRSLDVLPASMVAAVQPSVGAPALGGDAQAVALARSRAEAHASVANLRNWESVDVSDYVLLSDQRRGANQLIRDLERSLDTIRSAYAAMVPPLKPIQSVGIIRLFADQEEYARYVGESFAWSAGLWNEARGELVIRPVEARQYSQVRERILRTIFHEAFHQYLSLATHPLRVGIWFNEGHAVLFEYSSIRQGRVQFEEFEPYVALATGLPLAEVFALTHENFYGGTQAQRQQRYASAWALVYYLRRSEAADLQFRFKGLLDTYMATLARTGNGPEAIQSVLTHYGLEALEADFRDFWQSPRRRTAAERAPALPMR